MRKSYGDDEIIRTSTSLLVCRKEALSLDLQVHQCHGQLDLAGTLTIGLLFGYKPSQRGTSRLFKALCLLALSMVHLSAWNWYSSDFGRQEKERNRKMGNTVMVPKQNLVSELCHF